MNNILFHVPHSSLKIPNRYWNICIKDRKYIEKTNLFLSDYLTDKLIPSKCHKIIFKYSRIFCDVEKFRDDSKEGMAKKGMGVIYTNDCDTKIASFDSKYKSIVLKSYYDKYHAKLDKVVTNIIKKYNKCVIIDLHSFSSLMVEKLFGTINTPDICIGVDEFYSSEELINLTVNHFKEYGYSVFINNPYSGTMIPNKYFNKKEKRLTSIMIEINKRVYLDDRNSFYKLKNCLEEYYNKIRLL